MLSRQRTGSILCPSCGKLVGVNDEVCLNCGRKRPGMWGLTSVVRNLGRDLGFVQAVIVGNAFLYMAMLVVDPQGIRMGGLFSTRRPQPGQPAPLRRRRRAPGVRAAAAGGRSSPPAGSTRGLLHIGFNLYWIRILAPETAELYGPGRMVILYTISSISGFLAQQRGWALPCRSSAERADGRGLGADPGAARRHGVLRPAHRQRRRGAAWPGATPST